ncbi:MAG: ABC transporter ATP-binding protein [Melioribacteraceae bacterium]
MQTINAIEINDLKFSYSSKTDSLTYFNLSIDSLSIPEGEFVSILGPNGCGKSTLLRLVANLLAIQHGTISIFGKSIQNKSGISFAKTISYVPQMNYSIFPYSVYEIVMMGRTPYLNLLGFEKSEDRKIVNNALAQLEVEHLANKGINEISGGEAQRVFIARALAQDSKIILLDEPNSHLDIEHQISIFELLRNVNRDNGKTIITVSHDLNLVGIYSNRVVVMNAGTITLDGDRKTVLTKENIKRSFNVEAEVINGASDSMNVLVNPVN